MSQWGAFGMAQMGKNYQEILQHYFRGTTITTLPGTE
jgi:stage II sporulation protein D